MRSAIFILVAIMFLQNAKAADQQTVPAATAVTAEATVTAVLPASDFQFPDKNTFNFILGASTFSDGDSNDVSGDGLVVGSEWNITRFLGLGASYASYDAEGDNFELITGYAMATPIHFTYKTTKITAAAQIGLAHTGPYNYAAGDADGNSSFLGLLLEANYKNTIGFRLQSTMASASYSYGTLGVVGYY